MLPVFIRSNEYTAIHRINTTALANDRPSRPLFDIIRDDDYHPCPCLPSSNKERSMIINTFVSITKPFPTLPDALLGALGRPFPAKASNLENSPHPSISSTSNNYSTPALANRISNSIWSGNSSITSKSKHPPNNLQSVPPKLTTETLFFFFFRSQTAQKSRLLHLQIRLQPSRIRRLPQIPHPRPARLQKIQQPLRLAAQARTPAVSARPGLGPSAQRAGIPAS